MPRVAAPLALALPFSAIALAAAPAALAQDAGAQVSSDAGAPSAAVVPPRLVHFVEAEYPAAARAAGAFRFELAAPGDVGVTVEAPGLSAFHAEEHLADRDDVQVVYRLAAPTAPSAPRRAAANANAAEDDEHSVTVRGVRPPREVVR